MPIARQIFRINKPQLLLRKLCHLYTVRRVNNGLKARKITISPVFSTIFPGRILIGKLKRINWICFVLYCLSYCGWRTRMMKWWWWEIPNIWVWKEVFKFYSFLIWMMIILWFAGFCPATFSKEFQSVWNVLLLEPKNNVFQVAGVRWEWRLPWKKQLVGKRATNFSRFFSFHLNF